jgi:outer membrane protein assembly factor BamB
VLARISLGAALAALVLAPAAGARPASAGPHIPLPDGWQPEGIAAGPNKTLYVGSLSTGAVLRLNPRTGTIRRVVRGREGRSAAGIEVAGSRLVVAGGATGSIFVYDRISGTTQATFNAGGSFINDIAPARGGFYATDSLLGVLYRVPLDFSGAAETVPLPDIPQEDGLNLNGIVGTSGGRYLIAVQSNTGALWRITPETGRAVQLDIDGPRLVSGDGLLLRGHRLLVVQNRNDQIVVIKLDEGFAGGEVTGRLTADDFDVPTTLARLGRDLYAVNARFGTAGRQPAPYWVSHLR